MSSNTCKFCLKETPNPAYCSKSCAAKVNNKTPKRKKKIWFCVNCNEECGCRRKYCNKCLEPIDLTLKQAMYEKHHKSSAFALVRSRARNTKKAKDAKSCEKCGYTKHFEVCHIKPISKFSLDTKLSVINNEKNLLILCPNCHWEYDNKI
jgi:hypothetical protein